MGESTKNRLEPRIIGIVTSRNIGDPETFAALADCDAVELRADGLEPDRIPSALRALRAVPAGFGGRPLEIIVTLRLRRDGGAWDDARAAARESVWLSLLEGSDAFGGRVDVEAEEIAGLSPRLRAALARGPAGLIVSSHDFRRCPSAADLGGRLESARRAGGGFKAAVTCASRDEILALLAFAREAGRAASWASVFSMGEAGSATRVLSPLLGCAYAYGHLSGGAVAPGQLSTRALRAFYRDLPARDWAAAPLPDLLAWAEGRLAGGRHA